MCLVAPGADSEVRQGGKFWPLEVGVKTGAWEVGLPLRACPKSKKEKQPEVEKERVSQFDVKDHSLVGAQSGVRVTVWGLGSQSGVR